MLLYLNGDSHTAAAEAANPHAFAIDDGDLWYMGRQPHPDNLAVSYGKQLSKMLDCDLYMDAESASSNDRILRTTREWITQNYDMADQTFMIIQWSTWEREEWRDDEGVYWQVNASGLDDVPEQWRQRYKQFVIDVDWQERAEHWHQEIWHFHLELKMLGIRHLFFNGNNSFSNIQNQLDWENCYIGPYDTNQTYNFLLRNNGFTTVNPQSWHFGPDAHCFWAAYLLQYIKSYQLLDLNEISTD